MNSRAFRLSTVLPGVAVTNLSSSCIRKAGKEKAPPYNVLFIAIDHLNDWTAFLGGHPQTMTKWFSNHGYFSMAWGKIFHNANGQWADPQSYRMPLIRNMI